MRAIGDGGMPLATWVVVVAEPPDLGHVDLLARLRLAAGRTGAVQVSVELSPRLAELLELTGLGQMGREPEEREDGGSVEKGVIGGDPPA